MSEVISGAFARTIAADGKKHEVLVVDDDCHFRALVRSLFEREGIQVAEAQGIAESFAYLRAHERQVAAVVLDLMLTDGDGNEAIGRLKRTFPRTRIIAVSAMDEQLLQISKELGADAVLPKTRVEYLPPLLMRVLNRHKR